MGCPLKRLQCSIRHDGARVLTWTMKPGTVLTDRDTLNLECSRAGGPWEVLAEHLEDQCSWIDTRRRNYNKRLDECYRLRLYRDDQGCDCVSDIVNAGNYGVYPYSPEAENVLLQVEASIKMSGCSGNLLKRKLWGPRCPECVDFDGQQTVNEHCPRCLGTGIDGGYFPGIRLDVIKDSIQRGESCTQLGSLQGETVTCRCIAYPWIGRGDVWVEDGSDRRYVIDQVTPAASYRQTTLVYTMSMHLVELDDVLHTDEADRLVESTGAWEDKSNEPEPKSISEESGEKTVTYWDQALSDL